MVPSIISLSVRNDDIGQQKGVERGMGMRNAASYGILKELWKRERLRHAVRQQLEMSGRLLNIPRNNDADLFGCRVFIAFFTKLLVELVAILPEGQYLVELGDGYGEQDKPRKYDTDPHCRNGPTIMSGNGFKTGQ